MKSGYERNRIVEKLERVIAHSLSGTGSRVYGLLGIEGLKRSWTRESDVSSPTDEHLAKAAAKLAVVFTAIVDRIADARLPSAQLARR